MLQLAAIAREGKDKRIISCFTIGFRFGCSSRYMLFGGYLSSKSLVSVSLKLECFHASVSSNCIVGRLSVPCGWQVLRCLVCFHIPFFPSFVEVSKTN